jgi:hypothetical protein
MVATFFQKSQLICKRGKNKQKLLLVKQRLAYNWFR